MSDLLTDMRDGVLTIQFNRTEKKNSMTAAMYTSLASTLKQANADSQVRVVVFRGDERIFSAGNDLGDFVQNPPNSPDAPVWGFLRELATFPKPVLAAVCGAAVGIGTTMLLHCDLVFAGENAKFSLPFVNLGICPEAASSLLLPQLAGYQRAARAMLTGEPFDANDAAQMGLVNQVLPSADVLTFVQAEAAKLTAKPMSALIQTKRLMKVSMRHAVEAQMKEEASVFGEMITAGAAKEAIAAFSEKRKPNFAGL
ncbi:enoyl-CoA hydratase [Dyella humicola]|uniref:enoyl-CoA hydratase n=1 Tax=Dyella humicola TaxID=2992126 RepID=UPI002250F5FC|nr:enoyl-CoA hydratase [Dyella humicola]